MYIIKVDETIYNKIKNKIKVYEVCVLDATARKIVIGDTLLYKCDNYPMEGAVCRVVDKKSFSNFTELATALSIKHLGYDGNNIQEVVESIHKDFSIDSENAMGVVAIKFELVN